MNVFRNSIFAAVDLAIQKMNSREKWHCQDPSTSLRISLGGSDAARTAQDVLFRD
jgi:hypothetical protein